MSRSRKRIEKRRFIKWVDAIFEVGDILDVYQVASKIKETHTNRFPKVIEINYYLKGSDKYEKLGWRWGASSVPDHAYDTKLNHSIINPGKTKLSIFKRIA